MLIILLHQYHLTAQTISKISNICCQTWLRCVNSVWCRYTSVNYFHIHFTRTQLRQLPTSWVCGLSSLNTITRTLWLTRLFCSIQVCGAIITVCITSSVVVDMFISRPSQLLKHAITEHQSINGKFSVQTTSRVTTHYSKVDGSLFPKRFLNKSSLQRITHAC